MVKKNAISYSVWNILELTNFHSLRSKLYVMKTVMSLELEIYHKFIQKILDSKFQDQFQRHFTLHNLITYSLSENCTS